MTEVSVLTMLPEIEHVNAAQAHGAVRSTITEKCAKMIYTDIKHPDLSARSIFRVLGKLKSRVAIDIYLEEQAIHLASVSSRLPIRPT